MKQCNKCKEGKDENKFNKDRSKKDGLKNQCRECSNKSCRKWHGNNKEEKNRKDIENYRNNREERNEKQREYDESHREEISQRKREYTKNHKEEINQRSVEYNNSPLEYNSTTKIRKKIEGYEEIKKSKDGNVKIKCANCENGFEPIKLQIRNRLSAINGIERSEGAENRLYCSNKCKEDCPVYGQQLYPKYHKPYLDKEVQPELAEIVLERDEYTCIICQRHQSVIKMQCHHIEGIRGNPLESADMDTCTTLCIDCHKEVHSEPGCTYNDLKCFG